MKGSVDPRLSAVHGKALAMKPAKGETGRKEIATDDQRFVGALIVDTLRNAKITDQQAAALLGYEDTSTLSRWKNGQDVPVFLTRLLRVALTRKGFFLAVADVPNDDIRAKVVIEVGRESRTA